MAPLGAWHCFAPGGWVWLYFCLFVKRDECLKGQDSDMEYAEEHEKSEKDFKFCHSAGKGNEGGEYGMANESKINSVACWQCFSSA